LTILDPYGNGKTVLFEVSYTSKWKTFEIFVFAIIGIIGGALGAMFVKACRFWARTYRRIPMIKYNPILDTGLIAILTALTSYWNTYAQLGDSELLSNLTAPCERGLTSLKGNAGCAPHGGLSSLLNSLALAFLIKGILTIVSFGLKVPAGIYIPSMAVGALLGKFIGHIVEEIVFRYPNASLFSSCPESNISCVTPGVYALIGAGVTMCGVTRLPVTLSVILFELTGSLDYMICFCNAIFVSKWIADCIEPASIYVSLLSLISDKHDMTDSWSVQDLVSDLNSYPVLEESRQHSKTTLGNLLLVVPSTNIVMDLTNSPIIPAAVLQNKLDILLRSGDYSGLLLIEQDAPIGFIRTADLQQALGKIDEISHTVCRLFMNRSAYPYDGMRLHEQEGELSSYCIWRGDEFDLTTIVEQVRS
jgi:chloride channel 3/4/5